MRRRSARSSGTGASRPGPPSLRCLIWGCRSWPLADCAAAPMSRMLALGATAGGLAAPVLRAYKAGGYAGTVRYLQQVIATVRAITFLAGCQRPSELASAPRVLGSRLRAWIEAERGSRIAAMSAAPVISATACGKVILLGEHAVVYGVPALCGALSRGAEVQVLPARDACVCRLGGVYRTRGPLLVDASQASSLAQAYAAVLQALPPPFRDVAGHDFVAHFSLPTGAGLGSSAAFVVALARALSQFGQQRFGRALDASEIDAAAFAAERVFHGQPSGLDHTVAQQGGFGLFQRGSVCARCRWALGAAGWCIGHTGRARDTKGTGSSRCGALSAG